MGVRGNLAVVGFERPVTAVAAVELPPYEMHDPVFCLFFLLGCRFVIELWEVLNYVYYGCKPFVRCMYGQCPCLSVYGVRMNRVSLFY